MLGKLKISIDGLICPGHVAAITGIKPFHIISDIYSIPAVICGFEALDILAGVYELVKQISGQESIQTVNLYKSCVMDEGNILAVNLIKEVFIPSDVNWRGIGVVADSAYVINKRYKKFDALEHFGITISDFNDQDLCLCGDILLGRKKPSCCPAFARTCTPEHPVGPCMVSSEGACSASYKEVGEDRCLTQFS
jgi:hydrogenase expression/formation protein HypD